MLRAKLNYYVPNARQFVAALTDQLDDTLFTKDQQNIKALIAQINLLTKQLLAAEEDLAYWKHDKTLKTWLAKTIETDELCEQFRFASKAFYIALRKISNDILNHQQFPIEPDNCEALTRVFKSFADSVAKTRRVINNSNDQGKFITAVAELGKADIDLFTKFSEPQHKQQVTHSKRLYGSVLGLIIGISSMIVGAALLLNPLTLPIGVALMAAGVLLVIPCVSVIGVTQYRSHKHPGLFPATQYSFHPRNKIERGPLDRIQQLANKIR